MNKKAKNAGQEKKTRRERERKGVANGGKTIKSRRECEKTFGLTSVGPCLFMYGQEVGEGPSEEEIRSQDKGEKKGNQKR